MGLIQDLGNILQNIDKNLPYLKLMLGGIVYLMGVFFAIKSLLALKKSAESGKGIAIKAPLLLMITAVALLYSPTFIDAAMQTIYGQTKLAPAPYLDTTLEYAQTLLEVSGRIIQVVGFIAFVRGWIILARYGEQGGKGGELGKAITHIIGGLLAINIFGTFKIITGILGI